MANSTAKFNISDYLERYDKETKRGTCKVCFVQVQWIRERVASHKRGNCTSVNAEEKILFAKQKFTDFFPFDNEINGKFHSVKTKISSNIRIKYRSFVNELCLIHYLKHFELSTQL